MEFELDEDRARKAFDAVVKYLAASPRSEQECRDKLYEKGFHKDEVEHALEKAKGYHFINDEEYIRTFLLTYRYRLGRKMLAYKLINDKGVDRQLVLNMLADTISDEEEREKCRDIAKKYAAKKRITDKTGAQKVSAYLYQKGFDFSVINSVMATLFDVFEED